MKHYKTCHVTDNSKVTAPYFELNFCREIFYEKKFTSRLIEVAVFKVQLRAYVPVIPTEFWSLQAKSWQSSYKMRQN